MITTRAGWETFNGGGTNERCGEDQTDGDIVIPPIVIHTFDGDDNAIDAVFYCDLRPFDVAYRSIKVQALGGIPPFAWTTSEGIVTITGPRTAKVSIMAGIEYFKPFVYGYYSVWTSPLQTVCDPGNNGDVTHRIKTEAVSQTYLIGYDCSGEPLGPDNTKPGSPGEAPNFGVLANYYAPNLQTFRDNLPSGGALVDVIGNTTDRIATTSYSGDCMSVTDGSVDAIWSQDNVGCCLDGTGFNPLSLSVQCKTAGKACYNEGSVHISAPDFTEIFNLPINNTNPPAGPVFQAIYGVDTATNLIDVRTANQLPGHEVLVTATDYTGVTVAITVET